MEKTQIQVLLVEDNPTDALLLRKSLEKDALTAFDLITVERLRDAMKAARESSFNIILLDLGLPDSQGLDTFTEIHAATPDIPKVILSGQDDEVLALQAVQAGAQDYIAKSLEGFSTVSRAIRYAIERHKTEGVARANQERFSTFFHSNPSAIAITRLRDNRFLEVNEAWTRMTGFSTEDAVGRKPIELNMWVHPEQREQIVGKLNNGDHVRDFEFQLRCKSGEVVDLLFFAEMVVIDEEPCMLSMALDITERKRFENQLRESDQRFTEIANNIPDIFWVSEPRAWKSLYFSPAFQSIVGRSIETVSQLPNGALDVLLPEDRHILAEARKQEDAGMKADVQYRIQRPDGSVRWIRDKGSPVFDENGKVVRVVGVARDLTEQIEAETQLRESELRLRQMAENIQEVFWMFDRVEHRHVYANHAYEIMFDVTEDILRDDPDIFIKRVALDDLPIVRFSLERQKLGERTEMEYRVRRTDGTIRWVWDRSFPVYDENGKLIRTAGVITDITERKLAGEEIGRRLAELEMLYDSGLILNRLSDPEKIGEKIIELLEQKMDWHHSVIRLYNAQDQSLRLLAFSQPSLSGERESRKVREHIDKNVSRPGEGLSGWAVKDNQIIRGGNVNEDPRYRETYPGMRSGLYVPLSLGGKVIGVVSIESEKPDAFSQSDERLVATLCSQAAIAIENARLNSDLERRVEERTAEVRDLYDNAPTGYHSLDADGCFRRINQTELNWLGYSREEILGRSFGDFLTTDSLRVFEANFPEFKKRGRVRDLEFELIRMDGSTFPVLVNATAIYDEQGRYVTSRSTMFDNTERKKAEEALQSSEAQLRKSRDDLSIANAALEKAARMKDEFLASMSHELRTPLTGILGLSEALQLKTYGELNERQFRALRNIEESGRHLLELINDILDLSKIGAGKLELQFAPCSIADICQASLQITKGMAHHKRQTVHYSPPTGVMIVDADARRLKQILVNLLGNAVKFTPEEGELGLEVSGDESRRIVKLTVWDKGIGIKAGNLRQLFDPFTQLDSSLAREYSGTGLGLSLVHRLVELHNGSVEVESTFGEGSRFSVVLPWLLQDATPISHAAQPGARKDTGPLNHSGRSVPPKVFVVDDAEVVVQLIGDYLETRQYRVSKARSGFELISQVAEVRPDVIVLDIQMPGMDGLEVIRFIRNHADPLVAMTPIIAVTALAMTGDRELCLETGANEYMSKPIKLRDLAEILNRLTGDRA